MDGNSTVQIVNCVLTIPTSLTATVGNLLVLISIWKTPSLHKPSNVLLFGLALSDLGIGLVAQPIFVFYSIVRIKGLKGLFFASKRAINITGYFFSGVSLLTLTGISLDRHVAIRLHLRYKEIVTVNRVAVILTVIWVALIPCATSILWDGYNFVVYMTLVVVLMCLLVTTFSYCWIYRVVRRHHAQISAHISPQVAQQPENSLIMSQFKKSCCNMLLIYLVFIFCYLPCLVVEFVIAVAGNSTLNQSVYEIASAIVLINSTLNPILYCWRIGEIRAAVVKTARTLFAKDSVQ